MTEPAVPAAPAVPAPAARTTPAVPTAPATSWPNTVPSDEARAIDQRNQPSGVLATAVYLTGSTRLESGRRFAIAIQGDRLRVLGPTDIDATQVALDRPLATITAHAVEGRFIASDPSGVVLAFMAVSGATPQRLASLVNAAARELTQS